MNYLQWSDRTIFSRNKLIFVSALRILFSAKNFALIRNSTKVKNIFLTSPTNYKFHVCFLLTWSSLRSSSEVSGSWPRVRGGFRFISRPREATTCNITFIIRLQVYIRHFQPPPGCSDRQRHSLQESNHGSCSSQPEPALWNCKNRISRWLSGGKNC